ncbi:MAG: signal peptidase I [Clostridiaceae bacterium]|jgi:signal peptidase I|nr:signal peptidase I [Clostridiaceae bacterium]
MTGEQKTNIVKEVFEWIAYFASAVIIASLLQSQLFALTTVHQSSMQNTLFEGHMLIMNKVSYYFTEPKKGDIIVFLNGENTEGFINRYRIFIKDVRLRFQKSYRTNRLIKRVIAAPGDTIDIRDGKVYINGEAIDEPYVNGVTPSMSNNYPLTLKDGEFFVMGDNRENSSDSRSFGPIKRENIEGRAMFRIYPFTKIGRP